MNYKDILQLQQEADKIKEPEAQKIITQYQKLVYNILQENKILKEELLKDSYWDEDYLT